MSHANVVTTVKRWKSHEQDALGVPMSALFVDVDTAQTRGGLDLRSAERRSRRPTRTGSSPGSDPVLR